MNADERESQLSAMFDGELPETECELLARRLSRDTALKQQWARYSLIGAVIRDEPLRAGRDTAGRLAAGIAGRLAIAIEAEASPELLPDLVPVPSQRQVSGSGGESAIAMPAVALGALRARWARPAAGFAIAAGVAALSVVWLQGRTPVPAPLLGANPADAMSTEQASREAAAAVAPAAEIIAPAVAMRGSGAEVVVAANSVAPAAARGAGSGEPESYVVPMPAGRTFSGVPAQLANYVVAHSEFSAPLSRRSLLSALVASEAGLTPVQSDDARPAAPPAAAAAAADEARARP